MLSNLKKLPFMATGSGFVYMGTGTMTDAEYKALEAKVGRNVPVDPGTTMGRFSKEWLPEDKDAREMGGPGSHTYETQHVGDGVVFIAADRGPVFHINPRGEYVRAELNYPRTGRSFHRDVLGSLVAGPKPDSEADNLLGGNQSYIWDEDGQYWVIG